MQRRTWWGLIRTRRIVPWKMSSSKYIPNGRNVHQITITGSSRTNGSRNNGLNVSERNSGKKRYANSTRNVGPHVKRVDEGGSSKRLATKGSRQNPRTINPYSRSLRGNDGWIGCRVVQNFTGRNPPMSVRKNEFHVRSG